jgi:hypothetical protein
VAGTGGFALGHATAGDDRDGRFGGPGLMGFPGDGQQGGFPGPGQGGPIPPGFQDRDGDDGYEDGYEDGYDDGDRPDSGQGQPPATS